jgi:hypothetical protein
MSLLSKRVELTANQISPTGGTSIRAGESGVVVWDEPDGDVIVEFARPVPNGGLLRDARQAWIPRGDVMVIATTN